MAESTARVTLDNLSNIFTSVIDNLQLVIDQVQDGESGREAEANFSLDAFWKRIELVAKLISKESTTLCLAFIDSSLPNPENCSKIIQGLEKTVIATVSAFYSLPKECGMTLRKEVQMSVVSLMQSVQEMVKVIQTEGGLGGQMQRTRTGNVWELCDDFPNLPHDNVAAVLKVSRSTSSLIGDALEEILEVMKNEGDGLPGQLEGFYGEDEASCNEDTWSEADKILLGPSVGMVKAARSCVKKTATAVKNNGSCDSDANIAQLDDIGDTMKEISPIVDDLVCSLYGPMRHNVVRDHVVTLSNSLKQILGKCKHSHVSTEDDSAWIEFLETAIQHNLDKVKGLVPQDLT